MVRRMKLAWLCEDPSFNTKPQNTECRKQMDGKINDHSEVTGTVGFWPNHDRTHWKMKTFRVKGRGNDTKSAMGTGYRSRDCLWVECRFAESISI